MMKNKQESEKNRKEEKEKATFFGVAAFSSRPAFENRLKIKNLVAGSVVLVAAFGFGCQPNQTILKDVVPSPTPLSTVELKATSFEDDLRDMQTANFDYILVFRRKDGAAFDDDDRKFLRQNTPIETNRWTKSEDGRAYIAGSGFGFAPQQLEALKKRFVVEDFSKPETKESANTNANTSANTKANVNSSANDAANKK